MFLFGLHLVCKIRRGLEVNILVPPLLFVGKPEQPSAIACGKLLPNCLHSTPSVKPPEKDNGLHPSGWIVLQNAKARRDLEGARSASRSAKNLLIATIVCGIVVGIVAAVVRVVVYSSTDTSDYYG